MRVTEQPSLKPYNTFGVEAGAGLMLTLESDEDLLTLPPFNPHRDLVLGGGSNILFASDVPGTVIHNRICGKEVVESRNEHVWIETGAGENWHELVEWTLDQGLSGLENLSLIPGLAGAAPIQNIGAYGVELSSVLETVTAWDLSEHRWAVFSHKQCRLAYRDSIFKSGAPGRYLISSVRLRLNKRFVPHLDYAGLREELSKANISQPTPSQVSDAVITLRQRKLPDPAVTGNAGSFFKNPALPRDQAMILSERYPEIPAWPQTDGTIKISAAWMIEHCGLKGRRIGGAAVSDRHALVIINTGSATGRDILQLANSIQSAIHDTFGVRLEPEPRIVDFPA